MADEVVAYFQIQLAGRNAFFTHGTIEVCGNEQFVLGRDMSCRYSWYDDFTISREHLRVHCVLYEEDPNAKIAPCVYVTDLSTNGTYLKKINANCTGSQGRGILMGKNGSFLLDDGDELQLSDNVTLIYRSSGEVKQSQFTETQDRERESLSSRYLITGRLLGEGGYGRVLIGIDQTTKRQLACKMVDLEKLYGRRADISIPANDTSPSFSHAIRKLPHNVRSCFREFDILKDLSHPNIVHIQKVFWSRSTIYMFQELVTGGDLFSYIQYKHGKIPSIESAVIIRQVLKGVQYLHEHDIVHRDLKPDNILMTSLDNGARVVITDFGHARFLPNTMSQRNLASNKLGRMFSVVGTVDYAAPEIHRMNEAVPRDWGYSLSVDMWSIGSITAAILTGELLFSCRGNGPFEENAQSVVLRLAAQCNLSILDDNYHPLWGPIAPAPKDFIKRLLVLDEEKRMSATEALDHVWFTHPMMAGEFNAQYERSIKDWRPRHQDDQLVEQMSALEPVSVQSKTATVNPYEDAPSQFFRSKRVASPDGPAHKYRRIGNMLDEAQLTSQHETPPYYDGFAASEQSAGHINSDTDFDESHDATRSQGIDQRPTDADHASDGPPMPWTTEYEKESKAAAGQLHRLSTSTRGRYFRREATDIDELEASANEDHDITDVVKSNREPAGHMNQHQSLGRGETVLVRTTPGTDEAECGDIELWWHHRYPQTQFHYDMLEPNAQDEDEVLVQETPPEIFKRQAIDLTRVDGASRQARSHLPVRKASLARRTGKLKKVYGRRH